MKVYDHKANIVHDIDIEVYIMASVPAGVLFVHDGLNQDKQTVYMLDDDMKITAFCRPKFTIFDIEGIIVLHGDLLIQTSTSVIIYTLKGDIVTTISMPFMVETVFQLPDSRIFMIIDTDIIIYSLTGNIDYHNRGPSTITRYSYDGKDVLVYTYEDDVVRVLKIPPKRMAYNRD